MSTLSWDDYMSKTIGDVPSWITDPLIGCGFVVRFIPETRLPQIIIVDENRVPNSAELLISAFFLQYAMLLSS